MKKRMIFIILILMVVSLEAQDRHYWDQIAGGKAALLGGVAVAGVRDYSATFYNPGALGFLSKNSMNFNLNMYGIKDYSFKDGGGPGIDSRYTRVSLYPASLAGGIPFLSDSLSRFSFMIYSSGYSYVRISERYEGFADVIPTRPPSQPGFGDAFAGNEYLINQGKIDVLLSEVSVGFGYAKKVSDNVGLGVSLIGAYRDQTKIRYESNSAFDTTYQRMATTDLYIDLDYWAVRFSFKFGISAEWEKLKLGLTLTTPSMTSKFFSGGTDHASLKSNNVLVLIDSTTNQVTPIDVLASDRQEGLYVRYLTPLSIAAGMEYQVSDATRIHLAMEWFAPLPVYTVMQPESGPFIHNNSAAVKPEDSADLLKVYDSMKSVFNVGIALEQKLSEKFSGYASFRTDFSNANFEDINGLYLGFTDFNIYHFTLGASANIDKTFLSVGLEYSHADRPDFTQIFNFPTGVVEPGDIAITSQLETTRALYNTFNLFFGVTQMF